MDVKLRETMEGVIEALTAKDLDSLMSYFDEQAVLIDPHFPLKEMHGKPVISCGYKWAFQAMKNMDLKISNIFSAATQDAAVFELDVVYALRTGQVLRQAQTFVVEMNDQKITRLQAYTSHAPKGADGMLLRLLHRLRSCIKAKLMHSQTASV